MERCTPIGLTDKYLSRKGIVSHYITDSNEIIYLHQGGEFSFYSEEIPYEVLVNGNEVPVVKREKNLYSIDTFCYTDEVVLEIIY